MKGRSQLPGRVARAGAVALLIGLVLVVAIGVDRGEDAHAEPGAAGLFGGAIPLYPDARGVTMLGEGLELNGMPLTLGHFVTDDPPEAVLDFYAEAFDSMGLDVQVSDPVDEGGVVVAWDLARGHQRSVGILRQGDKTMVFPAVVPLRGELSTEPAPLPPAPSGSRLVSDVLSRDGGVRARSITMLTPLSEEAAAADLVGRLRKAGWQASEPQPTLGGRVLEATDASGRRCSYVISGAPDRPTGVVAVLRSGS